MSIYNLATSPVAQPSHRDDGLDEAADAIPSDSSQPPPQALPDQASTLDNLTRFIPTESITLYVAGMGVSTALEAPPTVLQPVILYWICAALTPILFVLLLLRKRAIDGQTLMPERWPIWRVAAATIAFLVWALAVPNSPYLNFDGGPTIAGFGAVVVSTFLSLLDPIMSRFER